MRHFVVPLCVKSSLINKCRILLMNEKLFSVSPVELTDFLSFFSFSFFFFLFFFLLLLSKVVFVRLFFCLSFCLCLSVCLPASPSLSSLSLYVLVSFASPSHLPRQTLFSHHALACAKQTRRVPNTIHSKASLPQLSHATIIFSLSLSLSLHFSLPLSLSLSNLFLCLANTNAPHS